MMLIRLFRLLIGRLLIVATVLSSFAFLLVAYSPHIPPIRSVIPALMGLAFPVFLVVQFALTLYFLIRFHWRILLGLTLVWVLAWGAVTDYLPFNSKGKAQADGRGRTIKVVTYNVGAWGFLPHKDSKPNPILQYAKSSGADIFCIQEAMLSDATWGSVSSKQIRSYLKEEYPYIHIGQAQKRGSVLILLSKFPILESTRVELTSRTNGAFSYLLDIEGQELRLLNVHLESFRLLPQDAEEYLALAKRGKAQDLGLSLITKLGPAFRRRNIQANLLSNIIRQAGDKVLVCGDFNDTPISYTHHKLAEGLQDAFIERGSGFGFSYVQSLFAVRIDHILAGKIFRPLRAEIDHSITTSDHYPLTTILQLTSK